MPNHANKRLPLSCENCRARKIRCLGSRVPCDTCVRRGFAASCFYQRSAPTTVQVEPSIPETNILLEKITNVESLLKTHIELTSGRFTNPADASWNRHTPISYQTSSESGDSPTQYAVYGTLSRDRDGYVRYIPNAASPSSPFLDEGQAASGFEGSSSSFFSHSDFPFSADTASSRQQLLELLPPSSQCAELKDIFFEVFSPLFHVLHDPSFCEQYDEFQKHPQEVSLSFLALIFVVLAVAVPALYEEHPLLQDLGRASSASENIRIISSRYRSAAMRCLSADQFMWRHNLHTVQALVLLIYALSHAHGPAWALLGTTYHIAVAVGCHIDPSHLNVGRVEAEERRRCWAALMMLYVIQNTCLGSIAPTIHTAEVRLPEDIDDEYILDHSPFQGESINGMSSSRPSKMSYILFKFKLYQLASDVCRTSLSAVAVDWSATANLDHKIEMEEKCQQSRFSNLSDLPRYHQAHYYILNSYTNHLFLILHRPHLHEACINRTQGREIDANLQQSLHRCLKATSLILDNYNILLSTDALRPYRWYTYGLGSFHAFLAASTLALMIGHKLLPSDTNAASSVGALQTCLHWFSEISPRSDIATKATKVLRSTLHLQRGQPSGEPSSENHDSDMGSAGVAINFRGNPNTTSAGDGGGDEPDAMVHIASNGGRVTGYRTMHEEDTAAIGFDSLSFASVDLDGWMPSLELQQLVSTVPSQQWLAPSVFPWSQW